MNNIKNIFSLIRGYNIILSGIAVLISSYLLESLLLYKTLEVSIVVMSTMALGNIMNDFLDIESDKINHPNRVLVNNRMATNDAMILFSLIVIILLYFSIYISFKGLLFLYLLILPLLFSYNLYLKKIPVIGNLIVSLLLGSVFLFTELSILNSINILLIPFFLVSVFSFVREMIKDMQDYTGDKRAGMYTLPIIVGKKNMNYIIFYSILILITVLLFPFIFWGYNFKYLLLLIIFIEIPLIYSLILLIKYPSKKTYGLLADLLKVLTLGGLIIIMVSKK